MFLVHPTSIAAVDGSTVEFTCTANNTVLMDYIVNEFSAGSQEIVSIGLFEQLAFEIIGDMTLRRNLSVTVSSLYNNTEILCRAFSPEVDSNTATLTVQGNTHAHDNQ